MDQSDELKALCAALTPEAIEIVKTFPALFCSENHHFTKTDPDHMAYYGYVTDIKVQDNGIKIYFTKLNAFPQQILIDIAAELCIGGARASGTLCGTSFRNATTTSASPAIVSKSTNIFTRDIPMWRKDYRTYLK